MLPLSKVPTSSYFSSHERGKELESNSTTMLHSLEK